MIFIVESLIITDSFIFNGERSFTVLKDLLQTEQEGYFYRGNLEVA